MDFTLYTVKAEPLAFFLLSRNKKKKRMMIIVIIVNNLSFSGKLCINVT